MWLLPVTALAQQNPEDPGEGECAWYDLFCHLQKFAEWFICWLFGLVEPMLQAIFDAVPQSFLDAAGDIGYWMSVVNQWFPVYFAGKLLLTYYTFLIFFILIKLVLKLVPTVG